MSTVNVFRYSALGLGLFVGLKNDMYFRTAASKKKEQDAYEAKLQLVEDAKAEYAKTHTPVSKSVKPAGDVQKVNLEDPNVDFAAVILDAVDSLKS